MEGPNIYHSLFGNSQREQQRHAQSAPLAAKFEDCQQCFARICAALLEHPSKCKLNLAEESRTKFLAWAEDTGAATRTLDHSLRKASDMREMVLELLATLHTTLIGVIDHLQSTSLDEITIEDRAENAVLSEGISSDKQSNSDLEFPVSNEHILDLVDNINATVECLVRLIPDLRDPFPVDLYSRDASISDAYADISLAADHFPAASPALIERLGRANWKRRQYLNMLHGNRRPGAPFARAKRSGSRPRRSALGEVAVDAFNFQKPTFKEDSSQVKTKHSATAYHSISGTTNASSVADTVFSRTRSARADSLTSFAQSEVRIKHLSVPKPPVPLELGQKFLCLFCSEEIIAGDHIKTDKDWEYHVFRDLEPYSCTFNTCQRAEKTYSTRDDWFIHERDNHRVLEVWICPACRGEFVTMQSFEAHLHGKQGNDCDSSHANMLVSLCLKHSEKHLKEQICPLCDSQLKPDELKEHISHHLEQFALSALDIDDLSDEDDIDEVVSQGFDENVSEGRTKLQILNAFVEEQFGIMNLEDRELSDRGSFLEFLSDESGDEGPSKVESPILQKGNESQNRRTTDTLNVPLSKSLSASPVTRTASYPENENFIGRDSDLANLYKILSIPGRFCTISATGGMGKTATAVEFSYRYEQSFQCIFWVQADTRVGAVDSFSLIATALNLAPDGAIQDQEQMVDLSREFLNKTSKRWLLVFDNVNEWADIDDFLPTKTSVTNGSILITTRLPNLSPSPIPTNYYHINLRELGMEESRLLLLQGVWSAFRREKACLHPEWRIAGDIASLAGLPLAITHISGYVKTSGCTLADFFELWNEWCRNSLLANTANSTHDTAIEMIWSIGLPELGVNAMKLLQILAFLDSDGIPKELLLNDHTEPELHFLNSTSNVRFRKIVNDLTQRRLITIKSRNGQDVLQMHRLLQHRLLQDMNINQHTSDQIFHLAFELVQERLPQPSLNTSEPINWILFKDYLPHVLSLQKIYTGDIITVTPYIGLAQLFYNGGILLWQQGIFNDAKKLLSSAETILDKLDIQEGQLRADIHIATTLLIQHFGISYRAESQDRLKKILDFKLMVPTIMLDDEIHLNNARADYANSLLEFNDYKGAEIIYKDCYKKILTWGPEEDSPFDCAKLSHHIAYCFMFRQDFQGAIRFAEKAVALISLLLSEDKQLLLRYKFDLACMVLQSGDIERSLEMHKQILVARLDLQGRASYFTLQSFYAIGALCFYLGRYNEAEQWIRSVLAKAQERGGKNFWPEAALARTQFSLYQVLTRKGESTTEAQYLAAQARGVLSRLLPFDPLNGVTEEDEEALFDHLQPVFGGRFTGTKLLKYVS